MGNPQRKTFEEFVIRVFHMIPNMYAPALRNNSINIICHCCGIQINKTGFIDDTGHNFSPFSSQFQRKPLVYTFSSFVGCDTKLRELMFVHQCRFLCATMLAQPQLNTETNLSHILFFFHLSDFKMNPRVRNVGFHSARHRHKRIESVTQHPTSHVQLLVEQFFLAILRQEESKVVEFIKLPLLKNKLEI